jgi:AcrR family transcriptional regulator
MRKLLLESAMVVFAQKGITASVVQDVVAAAEVSQGSFYNYFRTSEDLLLSLAEELSNEVVQTIESVIVGIEEPALRVATAMRSYLHLMASYPIVAKFISQTGFLLVNKGSAAYQYLPRDLKAGQETGDFEITPIEVALDIIGGAGLMAIHRIASGQASTDYPEKVVEFILRSLGIRQGNLAKMIAHPLPALAVPPDSLFSRSQARLAPKA